MSGSIDLKHIYLDHNAATPVLPEVRERVAQLLNEPVFGNASSVHALGRAAKNLIEESRERLAQALGCSTHEVIFTSGGTESNHLALRGVLSHAKARVNGQAKGLGTGLAPGLAPGLAVSAFEHPSVLETAKALQAEGHELTLISPDSNGYVTVAALQAALAKPMALVSVLMAHNELGTVMPIADLAQMAHAAGALMHTDAVQAFGRMGPFSVRALGVDLLSASGHKLGGLKGAGLLYVKQGTPVAPQMLGGPQERQMRAGTENVLAIVAMAEAYAVWRRKGDTWRDQMHAMRKILLQALRARLPEIKVNSPEGGEGFAEASGLPYLVNTLHVTLPGCASDLMVLALDMQGLCVSAGAACASGSVKASQVMLAMGRSEIEARQVLRFSLGPNNDLASMPEIADKVAAIAAQVRSA